VGESLSAIRTRGAMVFILVIPAEARSARSAGIV
jgi:hypothetical protein